jgi:acyl carrier protein
MRKMDFLKLLDRLLSLDPGTLKGSEILLDIPAWDSLAVVGFVGLVSDKLDEVVSLTQLKNCKTIDDLCAMVEKKLTA